MKLAPEFADAGVAEFVDRLRAAPNADHQGWRE